jgi:hypothetical protein
VEIESAVANTGLLVAAGGTLTLDQSVTGAGAARIGNSGTLVAVGAFNEQVQFTGTTGRLELDHAQTYAGKITGFSHAGTTSLDLRDIHFVSAAETKFSGNASGGVLTVSDGTHTATITLAGNYTGVTFKTSRDGHGGVIITAGPKPAAVHSFVASLAGLAPPLGGQTPPSAGFVQATTTLLAHPRC